MPNIRIRVSESWTAIEQGVYVIRKVMVLAVEFSVVSWGQADQPTCLGVLGMSPTRGSYPKTIQRTNLSKIFPIVWLAFFSSQVERAVTDLVDNSE